MRCMAAPAPQLGDRYRHCGWRGAGSCRIRCGGESQGGRRHRTAGGAQRETLFFFLNTRRGRGRAKHFSARLGEASSADFS